MARIDSERLMSLGQASYLFGFALVCMALSLMVLGMNYIHLGDILSWGIILLFASRLLNRKA
jgi:hypothetical protein